LSFDNALDEKFVLLKDVNNSFDNILEEEEECFEVDMVSNKIIVYSTKTNDVGKQLVEMKEAQGQALLQAECNQLVENDGSTRSGFLLQAEWNKDQTL
jgi:hypothetical protein